MARTYSTSDLALNDPTDADWALAYVRFALRDKPNDASAYPSDSLEDEEINAALTGNKLVDDGVTPNVTYYQPHRVAADLLEGNPWWVTRFNAAGYSEELRDVSSIAKGLRRAGRWIDESITDSTDGRLGATSLDVRL